MSLPFLLTWRCWGRGAGDGHCCLLAICITLPSLHQSRWQSHRISPACYDINAAAKPTPETSSPTSRTSCPAGGLRLTQAAPAMWWEAALLQHPGSPLRHQHRTPSWGRRRAQPAWVRSDTGEPALTHHPSPRRRELYSQHF